MVTRLTLIEELRGSLGDLLGRNVPDMLVEGPAVSRWVQDLARTVAPKGVIDRFEDCGTGLQGSIEGCIRIGHGEAQCRRSTTQAGWGPQSRCRVFASNSECGVAELQLHRHRSAVGKRQPARFFCAEHRDIPGSGTIGIIHHEMNCDGIHAQTIRRSRAPASIASKQAVLGELVKDAVGEGMQAAEPWIAGSEEPLQGLLAGVRSGAELWRRNAGVLKAIVESWAPTMRFASCGWTR